jgi:sodium-dependent phosphate cotransporter
MDVEKGHLSKNLSINPLSYKLTKGDVTISTSNLVSSSASSTDSILSEETKEGCKPEAKKRNVAKDWILGFTRLVSLLVLLYIFICSLTFLTDAFRLIAGKSAGEIFVGNEVLSNPVVGLMIGVLFTVLVQSSSTCTTVIVSLVSSGVINVQTAIPMVMGANIGTSMTSTLVSLTHMTDAAQFERAFSAATVHDCFNWLAVIVLLIVEVTTGYLLHFTAFLTKHFPETNSGSKGTKINLLKSITKPFTDKIIKIDKSVLGCWSNPNNTNCTDKNVDRLLKVYCAHSGPNETHTQDDYCHFLFNIPNLPDNVIGGILLVISLLSLTICLLVIVKVLRSVLEGSLATLLKKFINADIPYVPWLTGYIAIVVGAVMTFVVQSSSVFTSTLTPLVGVGLISVDRMYPLVLGSNIGTTTTALLAGLASGTRNSVQIALCHLIFNITAILIFYPIPLMRWPLGICKILGRTTARYRWFAIFYLFLMFFLLPGAIMGLSVAGITVLFSVLGPLAIFAVLIAALNILQVKKPEWLPSILQNWEFLPFWMHSLDPMDTVLRKMGSACCCGCSKKCNCLSVDTHEMQMSKYSTDGQLNGRDHYALDIDSDMKR